MFGEYTLRERIGVGGMAEVFLALEPRSAGESRAVVIKRMLPHIASEPSAARMFEEEARLGGLIEHPNVVRVLSSGQATGQPYLVLELVPGANLAALAGSAVSLGGKLPFEIALYVSRELLAGLHAVHEAVDTDGQPLGIVHGDVSPSNVLMSHHGEVKLADFGIAQARLRRAFPQAAAGRRKGKLGYLAPEQVRGEPSDRRADVFAAAVVTSELLLGEPLFERGSELGILLAVRDARVDRLHAKADTFPEGLLEVLLEGLARDPRDRFASAAAFRLALDRFLTPSSARARQDLGRLVERVAGLHPEERAELATADIITMEPPLDDYMVERQDGTVVGPISFAQLVEGVTMGRIDVDDLVRLGDGPAKPLRQIGELAGHVPNDSGTSDGEVVTMGGAFVNGLARRVAERASGVWICRNGAIRKDVYLIDGVPEFVSSNLSNELLGEFLVSRNILARSELDMALAVLPRFDGRLGDTLTALGLIEPVMLFRYIAAQVREKLLELFTWQDGRAHFQEGARPAERYFPLGLDPWRVLSDGIQRRLEQGMEQATFAEHMLGTVTRTRVAVPTGLPEDVVLVAQLTQRDVPLQDLLDRLAAPGEADPHRPYRAIRMALALDLVRFA